MVTFSVGHKTIVVGIEAVAVWKDVKQGYLWVCNDILSSAQMQMGVLRER